MIAACATPEPAALQITFPPSEETELPSMRRVMQRPDFAGQAPNTSADAVSSVAQSPTRELQHAGQSDLAGTTRLETLSDGAFAIIITLLVLEIHRPSAAPGKLADELLKEWPSYVAYALAFIYVGVIWLNHQYMFERLCKVDVRPELDQSRHPRHGVPDPISNGSIGRCLPRRNPCGPKSSGGALRSDCRTYVCRLVAGVSAPPLQS